MSTTHSSFDQYCISHKTITGSHRAAAASGPEVCRECPMTYFPALPLLARNPGDATDYIVGQVPVSSSTSNWVLQGAWKKTATHLENEKAEHCDAGEVKAMSDLVHKIMLVVVDVFPAMRRPWPDDRSTGCQGDLVVGGGRWQWLTEQSEDDVDVCTMVAV